MDRSRKLRRNLAGIIAPLAVGFLITSRGSYIPGFELASIILFAGVFAYWFIVGDLTSEPETAASPSAQGI